MANSAVLLLPTPTISVIGAVSNARLSGSVTLTLPVPRPAISGSPQAPGVALTLPVPTLLAKGQTAVSGFVALTLPTPTLLAKGEVSAVGTVQLVLPVPVLSAHSPSKAALTLPVPKISAAGNTGSVGNVQLVLPVPVLTATGKIPFTASVVLPFPKPVLTITGRVGNVARVAITLRGIALAAEGRTGTVGTVQLVLPIHGALQASGYQQGTGSVVLTLPALHLYATGQTSGVVPGLPDGVVLPATVMHTETGALSHYTNFPFNSMCAFNGAYLGASAEGLFVLTGDTDNTTLIQAAARTGITDFGTSFLKRIDRCYVGYRTNGDLVVRVFTDEVNIRDYLITQYGKAGLHGNHTRIGKGLAARYWQFEIRNQNGAQFQLNAFELKPTHLRRRIGGGDA